MLNVYLSGEIHSNWREEIINLCKNEKLDISFSSPITNHEASDNCGVEILGDENSNFWKDHKGANINSYRALRTRTVARPVQARCLRPRQSPALWPQSTARNRPTARSHT